MGFVLATKAPHPHSLPTRGREASSASVGNVCPPEEQSSPSPLWGEIKGGGCDV